jgi:hypothetical protein
LRAHVSELADELILGPVTARIDTELNERHRVAHAELVQTLDEDRYLRLLDQLDDLVADPPFTDRARRPVRLATLMEKLQETLGEHQDSVVASQVIRELAVAAAGAGENGFTFGLLYALEANLAESAQRTYRSALRAAANNGSAAGCSNSASQGRGPCLTRNPPNQRADQQTWLAAAPRQLIPVMLTSRRAVRVSARSRSARHWRDLCGVLTL